MKSHRPFGDRSASTASRLWVALMLSSAAAFAHAAAGTPVVSNHDNDKSAPAEALPTPESRTLYTLGQLISRTLEAFSLTAEELEWVKSGLEDGVSGAPPRVDLSAEADGLHALQESRRNATLARERERGAAFAAAVAQSPGAERHPSGIIIQPMQAGSGATPTASDHVRVHYEGQTIDGTVFDSSRERDTPSTFPLHGVISCWTQALQTMREGARSRVICPAEFAYGERGSPPVIRPGATLVFDIELLSIVR